jgi:hypothetical protein
LATEGQLSCASQIVSASPSGRPVSAGHVADEPSQVSATSHVPDDARHTVPAGARVSTGHEVLDPVQASAGSQTPVLARHEVAAGKKPSSGQVVLEPVQVSVASHGPTAVRQIVPALPAGCWQVTLVPSHWSRVQRFVSAAHGVPLGSFASPGHDGFDPVHVSATSQTPADARQTTPALPAGCWHVPLAPSHWSRVHGLVSAVQGVPLGSFASVGQDGLAPVQLSAGSHSPVDARHVVPAFPAGWVHAPAPSHASVVHGLPSSVQAVPAGSRHVSVASRHVRAHSGPAAQGLPA